MAVQAGNTSNNLADLHNRPSELLINDVTNADPSNLLAPFAQDNMTRFHQMFPTNYHQHMPQAAAGPTMILNGMMFEPQWPSTNTLAQATGLKKRKKETSKARDVKWSRQQQAHQMTSCVATLPAVLQPADLINQVQGLSPAGSPFGKVLQGRCSHAEDDHSTITSCRPPLGSFPFLTTVCDGLAAELSKQQDDIMELLKVQTEQLRFVIEERTQLHSKAFLVNVGERLSCKLRDRDLELQRLSQKNLELEEKVNHLSLETRAWQSKAWSYDAMASVLRANLQQVLMHQSRCQAKVEGCGDSDDDAASAHIDEEAQHARAALAMTSKAAAQRVCKKCKSKETSVLLLPCLHLCLCSDCKKDVERCPTCKFGISECVQVYFS